MGHSVQLILFYEHAQYKSIKLLQKPILPKMQIEGAKKLEIYIIGTFWMNKLSLSLTRRYF